MSETVTKLQALLVEDDDERMAIFDVALDGFEVHRAKDEPTAVELLWSRGPSLDLVCLDHDLGIGCGDGQGVAREIAALDNPPPVLVHSCNPDGARAIAAILAEAGVLHLIGAFGACTQRDVYRLMQAVGKYIVRVGR